MLEITGLQGSWWVPDDPQVKPAGQLTFNGKDGGLLEAWGPRLGAPFGTDALVATSAPLYFDRIFGETEQGHVTLLSCRLLRASYSFGAIDTKQTIGCQAVIKGLHFLSDHEFLGARARLINLNEWVSLSSFKMDGQGGYSVDLHPGVLVNLNDDTKLYLNSDVSRGGGPRSIHAEVHNQLQIIFGRPANYDDIMPTWIDPFIDLLTLATFRPSAVTKLELADSPMDPGRPYYEVGLKLGYELADRVPPLWAERAILEFSDVEPDKHFPQWYDLEYRLQGVFSYTFGERYAAGLSPENRFINASTAAEAIIRELVPSKRKAVDLEDPAAVAFVESFPMQERELLTQRLIHANDESLHERLRFLYDATRPVAERVAPNGDQWIATVKRIRNDLTHQSGRLRPRVPPGEKLEILAESIFLLISVYILVQLGFSPEAINDWLDHKQRTRILVESLQASFPAFVNSI